MTLARARLGDRDARLGLVKWVDPVGGGTGAGPRLSRDPFLRRIAEHNQLLAIETLGTFADAKSAKLLQGIPDLKIYADPVPLADVPLEPPVQTLQVVLPF